MACLTGLPGIARLVASARNRAKVEPATLRTTT
ncbi:hypothetical protein COLO4_26262 [Corchorus olitorius]|uniref:Uncharacterized protein n=1 Tax=Corchorus olitorius TaxID=93759 RepID=A0A1R3HY37_9ROSI|nr:hypothetical protein COLO4_26262 [Corchorus olitorius]